MKGLNFADELHKINDMLMCSKEDFLYSYNYLSEDDYEETRKYIIDVFKKHYKTNNILADVDTYEENQGAKNDTNINKSWFCRLV